MLASFLVRKIYMTASVPHFGKIDNGGGLVARLCPTLATHGP